MGAALRALTLAAALAASSAVCHAQTRAPAAQQPPISSPAPPEPGFSYPALRAEAAAEARAKASPTEANVRALAKLRFAHALALQQAAGGDRASVAYRRFVVLAEAAARLDPDNADYWVAYGNGLLAWPELMLAQEHAAEAFLAAIAARSDAVAPRVGLGTAYFNMARFGMALDAWEQAFRFDPPSFDAGRATMYQIAIVAAGEIERGAEFYAEMIGRGQTNRTIVTNRAILAKAMYDGTRDRGWIEPIRWARQYFGGPHPEADREYFNGLYAKWRKDIE